MQAHMPRCKCPCGWWTFPSALSLRFISIICIIICWHERLQLKYLYQVLLPLSRDRRCSPTSAEPRRATTYPTTLCTLPLSKPGSGSGAGSGSPAQCRQQVLPADQQKDKLALTFQKHFVGSPRTSRAEGVHNCHSHLLQCVSPAMSPSPQSGGRFWSLRQGLHG